MLIFWFDHEYGIVDINDMIISTPSDQVLCNETRMLDPITWTLPTLKWK